MNRLKRFFNFWTEDRGLVFLLISITILIFIIYPLSGNSEIGSVFTNIFIVIVLFTGLMSVPISSIYRKILLVFLIAIIITTKLGDLSEFGNLTHFHIYSRILFLWILIVLIFIRVFNHPMTFFYRIAGSVTIYLLIGFIWANMYFIFYHYSPGSFHFQFPLKTEDNIMFNFVYYSFEILTTLGLGDIVPLHPFLKSIVILEALLGPLYLAVLIGRLVSRQAKPKA
jgi:Ion channel